MLFQPNPALGLPIYLQLMEQIRHAVETGALQPGEQLPGIRTLAEQLVINPTTVARAYRELEHEGLLELRQGSGAFISRNAKPGKLADGLGEAQQAIADTVGKLRERGLTDEEIRRMFEAELRGATHARPVGH